MIEFKFFLKSDQFFDFHLDIYLDEALIRNIPELPTLYNEEATIEKD